MATDSAPVTQHDLRRWLAQELNVELRDELVEQKAIRRCSNQRLLESCYQFKYPTYKEVYKTLIESMPDRNPARGQITTMPSISTCAPWAAG